MVQTPKVIQGLIIFSTVLGVPFLYQVYPLLPSAAFDFVAFGWVLFVVDSFLTFYRQRVSFILGFVLAILALAASLGEPSHYSIITGGNLAGAATIILGDVSQILIIVLVAYYILMSRRKDDWSWPGAESQA